MSWLFSQVLVEEYLGDISLDGEQCVQSSGNHTQQAYCAPDKMTDFSRLSRFGMTFKPLTENLGKELLMSYLAGFHAKTLAQLEKGGGITGSRSSMWKHMARIIGEVRPRYAFVENSPMLTTRGLGVVLGDLSKMGFDAEWGVLSAADVGANHLRERIWIVGKNTQQHRLFPHTLHDRHRWGQQQSESIEETNGNLPNSKCRNVQKSELQQRTMFQKSRETSDRFSDGIGNAVWWATEPSVGRVANGLAGAMDRIKAIGNGQVPLCAATAFNLLKERLGE
jgi:DNA (cytosine-5)-methyltransferase 1